MSGPMTSLRPRSPSPLQRCGIRFMPGSSVSIQLPPKDDNPRNRARNTNTGVCSLGPALYLVQTLCHWRNVVWAKGPKVSLATCPNHHLFGTGGWQETAKVTTESLWLVPCPQSKARPLRRARRQRDADPLSLSQWEQPCAHVLTSQAKTH